MGWNGIGWDGMGLVVGSLRAPSELIIKTGRFLRFIRTELCSQLEEDTTGLYEV